MVRVPKFGISEDGKWRNIDYYKAQYFDFDEALEISNKINSEESQDMTYVHKEF